MTGLQEGLLLAEAGPVHFQPGIDCASDWKPQDMAKVLDAQAPEAKLGEIALKASSLIGCQNRPELGGPKQPYRASDYKKLGKKARRLFVEQAISGLKTSPFFAQCRSLRNGFSARFEEQIQSDPTGKTIVALAVAGYATCPDSPSLPTQ